MSEGRYEQKIERGAESAEIRSLKIAKASMLVDIEFLINQICLLEHHQEHKNHAAIAKKYGIKRIID